MKIHKAIALNGVTYRSGFGNVSVINITPDKKKATHRVIYYAPRLFAPGEEVEFYFDGPFAIYKAPAAPKVRKQRKSYVRLKKRNRY